MMNEESINKLHNLSQKIGHALSKRDIEVMDVGDIEVIRIGDDIIAGVPKGKDLFFIHKGFGIFPAKIEKLGDVV